MTYAPGQDAFGCLWKGALGKAVKLHSGESSLPKEGACHVLNSNAQLRDAIICHLISLIL